MLKGAFASIVCDSGRTMHKPRTIGRTAVMDTGLPIEIQQNYLEMAAAYMDGAKIMTRTATIYEISHVNRLYHASGGSRRSPERSEGSSLRLLRHDASIEHGAFLYFVPPPLGRYEVVEIVRDVTLG